MTQLLSHPAGLWTLSLSAAAVALTLFSVLRFLTRTLRLSDDEIAVLRWQESDQLSPGFMPAEDAADRAAVSSLNWPAADEPFEEIRRRRFFAGSAV